MQKIEEGGGGCVYGAVMEDIVVLDAGRYGFVELKYYKSPAVLEYLLEH